MEHGSNWKPLPALIMFGRVIVKGGPALVTLSSNECPVPCHEREIAAARIEYGSTGPNDIQGILGQAVGE